MSKKKEVRIQRVERTWTTKSGKVRTKVYTYKIDVATGKRIRISKSKGFAESIKIINKKGQLNEKIIERLKVGKSTTEISDIEKRLHNWNKEHKGEALSLGTFKSMLIHDAIVRAVYNAGYSVQEAAEQAGVSVNDILNPANWVNGDFVNPETGERWQLNYLYDGTGAFTH